MSATLLFELDHSRKRLEYFMQLERKSAAPSVTVTKWIAIYRERIAKQEKKIQKLGLKTQLNRQDIASIAKRA